MAKIVNSCTLKIRGGVRQRSVWKESRKGCAYPMGKVSDIRCKSRSDIVCLEGNGYRPSHKGDGYRVGGAMYTLNSTEVHAICYGICGYHSNSMLSDNPHSGIYEANTSRTLDLNGGNPACNQGGICVVEIHNS